jgi:hypothetical protein
MLRSMIKLALVIFFFAVSINSQTITNYGLKLGAVASNPIWEVGSQSYDGVETRMGMDVGLFLNWSLTNNLSLLTEMHYIQKGLRFYQSVVNSSGNGVETYVESINPNVNYLSFPIFIKYDLLTSEVIPYIIGGLRVDFMISKSEANNPRWLYSNVNNMDFGGSIGLGFQTKSLLGIGTGLEIKYSPSFIKVDSSPMADITNRSFEINIILYK